MKMKINVCLTVVVIILSSCSNKAKWVSVLSTKDFIEISPNEVYVELEDIELEKKILVIKNYVIIEHNTINDSLNYYILKDKELNEYTVLYQLFTRRDECFMNAIDLMSPTFLDTSILYSVLEKRKTLNRYPIPQHKFTR